MLKQNLGNKAKITGGVLAGAIIASVIQLEGGYVNNSNDKGGETNHGITKKVAVENGYTDSMKDLTVDQAGNIYINSYMVKPNFMRFLEITFAFTKKITDAGVNVGTYRVSKWIQESLNDLSLNGTAYPKIVVDGKIGNNTFKAYNALEKIRGNSETCKMMIKMVDGKQLYHYISLSNNSKAMATFLHGWVINRIGNVPLDACDKKVSEYEQEFSGNN